MRLVFDSLPRVGRILLLRGLAVGAFLAGTLHAQVIWDGGAATGNWADNNNWSTNAAPPTGSIIQFAGSVQTVVNLGADRSMASVQFNAGASPFTLSNNTLTLTSATNTLVNNSTSTQTINSNLQLTAARSFTATSGSLVYGGNIFTSNSATNRVLTFTGAFNHTVTGVIANGGTSTAGAVTKTGTGTLTLSGANTYGGATTVSAGTLRATTNVAALGTGALAVATATLSLANDTGLNFGRNTTVTGTAIFESDRLTAGAGVTHTLGTFTTTVARVITLNAGSNVTSGTAGLTFGATTLGGTLTANTTANTLLTLGSLNATAARAITKNGTGTLLLNAASTGWITASTLTVNNGTVQLGASNALGASSLTNIVINANSAGATSLFDLNNNNSRSSHSRLVAPPAPPPRPVTSRPGRAPSPSAAPSPTTRRAIRLAPRSQARSTSARPRGRSLSRTPPVRPPI